jgi:hypothetical protein
MKIKKLKDILDMEDYLKKRCYCPGEIYSSDGFFFQIFSAETECKYLGEKLEDNKVNDFIAVISISEHKNAKPQILVFYRDNKHTKIEDAVRFDATENNIKLILKIIEGKIHEGCFDEFEEGSVVESLNRIMEVAAAIMIS